MKPSRIALCLALLAACSAPAPAPLPPEPPAPPPPATAPAAPPPSSSASAVPAMAGAVPKMPPGWPYATPTAVVASTRGMVSSDAQLATKVGQEMLAAGGNAVDAAVATAFALAVVLPSAGNIGGGGFMVARVGDKTHALDFREKAPGKAKADMFLGKDGKPTQDSRGGYLSSGVPGSVAGLFEAHKKLGSKSKSWKDVMAPAIKLAKEGFTVDDNFAKVVTDSSDKLQKHPASAALFLPGGKAPAAGVVFKNPDLAATLERIADQGPAGFYAGKTAELLVAEMKRGKGLISAADLKAYEAKWREPIEFAYRGRKVLSMPPPSSGGVTLGIMCGLLESFDIGKKPFQSPEHLQPVFEAMRRAFAARNATLGDPDVVKNPVEQLLSKAWLDQQRATITPGKATPSAQIGAPATSGGTGPHTTHFSVVDDAGNAVALTTTVNHWFGNGITVTGAGFVLNNEMDDFAVKAGTPNSFGLVQGEPNLVGPNKRMLSSMTPTVVLGQDGKVQLVTGAAGGPTIITAVFQILSNMVDFGLDPVTAVSAPRFHQQHMPDVVIYETNGVHADALKALTGMGYDMKERGHLADAPSIGRGTGGWIGAAEPRRRGAFAAGW
jgi:gamma-glutamyltranspeptidase/glutathione hydrolase